MNLFAKLRDFVGLNEPVYDYGYDDELDTQEYQNIYKENHPQPPEVEEVPQPRRRIRERPEMGMETPAPGAGAPMNNVIGMPGAAAMSEVIVMEPRSFEEMPQAIQALRERKSVVLNLTMMDPDQAQRAVDFVAGGTYAIDGHQERIGESIFLFTPSCVSVKTQVGGSQGNPQSQARPARPSGSPPSPTWTDNPAQLA